MTMKKLDPRIAVADLGRKCLVALVERAHAYERHPTQRAIMAGAAATTCALLFVATSAHAATDGLAGLGAVGAEQVTSLKGSFSTAMKGVGLIAAGTGGFNWWKKHKEGENSRVSVGQIIGPIVAGAGMGAIGFLLVKGGETVGIDSSQQGVMP